MNHAAGEVKESAGTSNAADETQKFKNRPADRSRNTNTEDEAMRDEMKLCMMIEDMPIAVDWEYNKSVTALMELVKDGQLTVQMSMYGGFEQFGYLGKHLPRADVQTTTKAGDIVLYAGNQIVVFYGAHSWAYTRLGRITNKNAHELYEILGNGDVSLRLHVK